MKLFEKILVATDFERASKDALQMAFVLAKEFHSVGPRPSEGGSLIGKFFMPLMTRSPIFW